MAQEPLERHGLPAGKLGEERKSLYPEKVPSPQCLYALSKPFLPPSPKIGCGLQVKRLK
ncbi:hypothetical protein WCP94_000483 (plasmid) [Bilophila wadsworthia]|jgi:hypothetical protein